MHWPTERMCISTHCKNVVACIKVVSDYLTPYDGEMRMMRTNNQPVVVYNYRMRFWRDASNIPSSA